MCCFLGTLVFFGPRLAFLIFWLIPWGRLKVAAAFDNFIIPLLGLIFLPWTTLAYVIAYPIIEYRWIWIALGLLADIAGYTAGYRGRSNR